jgi:hypothetical protein
MVTWVTAAGVTEPPSDNPVTITSGRSHITRTVITPATTSATAAGMANRR